MTIEQAAIEFLRGNIDPYRQERMQWESNIFKAGAEWMLEKTLTWFKDNVNEYSYDPTSGKEGINIDLMLKDFKKAIEG